MNTFLTCSNKLIASCLILFRYLINIDTHERGICSQLKGHSRDSLLMSEMDILIRANVILYITQTLFIIHEDVLSRSVITPFIFNSSREINLFSRSSFS